MPVKLCELKETIDLSSLEQHQRIKGPERVWFRSQVTHLVLFFNSSLTSEREITSETPVEFHTTMRKKGSKSASAVCQIYQLVSEAHSSSKVPLHAEDLAVDTSQCKDSHVFKAQKLRRSLIQALCGQVASVQT